MSGHDGHAGHDMSGHAGHDMSRQFRRLFWIMLVIAIPTIAFSSMFAAIFGYQLPDNAVIPWISPVLGTVMYFWGGRPFLTGAWSELKARKPGMMLLIGLAITVAYFASLGASLGILDDRLDFWWELALLIVVMLLGHWIEMRSIMQASSALDALAALLPDEAERVVHPLADPVEADAAVASTSSATEIVSPVRARRRRPRDRAPRWPGAGRRRRRRGHRGGGRIDDHG